MNHRLRHAVHILVLAFYCGYAISPIYLSAAAGRGHGTPACSHCRPDVTLGIVWVNVLLAHLVDSYQCSSSGQEVRSGANEREFILIRKKRAVLRESYEVRPLPLEQEEAALPDPAPARCLAAAAAPRSVHDRSKNLSLPVHSGLSPPHPSV